MASTDEGRDGVTLALGRLRRSARDDEGVTLVEVMTASLIFLIVSTTVLYGLMRAQQTTRENRQRTVAANVAAREMDTARNVSDLATLGNTAYDFTVAGEVYHVLRTAEWINRDATASPCDGGTGRFVAYKRINVRVTWASMGKVAPVQSDSIVNPGVGSYDPTLGNLGVSVLDRSAAPRSNVSITVTGATGTRTQTSGSDGCAFFAQLVPGTYTVKATEVGSVDEQGVVTPVATQSVNTGTTTAVRFTYDHASSLALALGSATHPAPANLPVTLANTRLQPSGVKRVVTAGTAPTIAGLFPFTSGYSVWSGGCNDADPEGKVQPGNVEQLYPDVVRPAAVTVTPGAVTSVTVPMVPVRVALRNGGGAALANVVVTATHVAPASGPDILCPGGETLTLGTTPADGDLLVSMPVGTWTLSFSDGGVSAGANWTPAMVGGAEQLVSVTH
jgi:type II secretory pathway pseudopilin PulG